MPGTNDEDSSESTSLYEREVDETPAEAVVTSVASLLERSPLEMEPLHEVIDPDALNSLFDDGSGPPSPVCVVFEYCGLEVTMNADGVRLSDPDDASG